MKILNKIKLLKIILFLAGVTFITFLFLFMITKNNNAIDTTTKASPQIAQPKPIYKAKYWRKLDNNNVQCQLCFRQCIILPGKRGFCQTRENKDGVLYTLTYALPCAIQIDPVEKEPAHHFLPGTEIFCIGTASCNLKCKFCHNWHLSHCRIEETTNFYLPPEQIIALAQKNKCMTFSFTYNEPTVFYEYMLDIVKLAKKNHFHTLFHTNGGINEKPLKELLLYIDAVTVDLKSFNPVFYQKMAGGAQLEPVLKTLKTIKASGKHLEIVNLIIPTLNDDLNQIKEMCLWIKNNLGENIPLHFTRYSPTYKFKNLPPTPIKTLENAKKIAQEVGLEFVYIGNVPGHEANSTYCPNCKKIVIKRFHFGVMENNLQTGKCKFCQKEIPGVWE